MQPAALTVPRFVTLPAKPAAHTVQDVTDTWTMLVLHQVQTGFEEQLVALDRVLAALAANGRAPS
jgi:hypothetical protein